MTKTTLTGASALAKKVRVIMSEPGTPEAAYGIAGIKVHFFPTILDDIWIYLVGSLLDGDKA